MKRSIAVLVLLVLAAVSPSPARAQLGPLFDWIHEMSGPRFFQWGTTYSFGYKPGLEFKMEPVSLLIGRLDTLAQRVSTNGVRPLDLGIAQITTQDPLARLRNRALAIAGKTKYREVLVDRAQTEIRALSKYAKEIIDSRESLNDTTYTQVLQRAERIAGFLGDLAGNDALDRGKGIRGRLAIIGGSSVLSDKNKNIDTVAVNIITIAPTAEYLISSHWAFESGIGIHRFFGDIEPFWSVSLPLLAVWRPLVNSDYRVLRSIRINAGANIFAPLDSDAFIPVSSIEGTGFEWVWTGFISLDFPIGM